MKGNEDKTSRKLILSIHEQKNSKVGFPNWVQDDELDMGMHGTEKIDFFFFLTDRQEKKGCRQAKDRPTMEILRNLTWLEHRMNDNQNWR